MGFELSGRLTELAVREGDMVEAGALLKGAGFAGVGHELVWLLGSFSALVLLTSLRFTKKLA